MDDEETLMLYERTEDFRDWCMERADIQPVWVKLFDCQRCIMQKDIYPFFTELEGVVQDRTYRYNELVTDRSFLVGNETHHRLFDWIVDNTSGKFTLIERSGWEGVLFDTLGDYTITRLMFSEYQAVIQRDPRGRYYDTIRHPPAWSSPQS